MTVRRAFRGAAFTSLLVASLGCPQLSEVPDELHLSGALDRDSVEGSDDGAVDVDFHSSGARAEWWPCDLRLTAQGCVGQHHVNVYLTLPQVTDFSGVGAAACVTDGEPNGVFEAMRASSGGEHVLGADLNAFVLVASDLDGAPGAVLNDDEETTAATRLVSGKVSVTRWAALEGVGLTLEGETAGGRQLTLDFSGPASSPGAVPTLEGPSTCVESSLLTQALLVE